ncbi:MAG: hypothetical protein IPN07_07095 [Dehalococcoidia bacterium]|nr:hypothetical protein [Dehalococcoidia bacterium]
MRADRYEALLRLPFLFLQFSLIPPVIIAEKVVATSGKANRDARPPQRVSARSSLGEGQAPTSG